MDNHQEHPLVSQLLTMNDIALSAPCPDIAFENDNRKSIDQSKIWVCGDKSNGGYNSFLQRKDDAYLSDATAIYLQEALTLLATKKITPICEGERKLLDLIDREPLSEAIMSAAKNKSSSMHFTRTWRFRRFLTEWSGWSTRRSLLKPAHSWDGRPSIWRRPTQQSPFILPNPIQPSLK